MSNFSGVRQDIADALSTVNGITGYALRPKALKAGDAWPRLNSVERGPGQSLLASWVVSVILGSDEVLSVQRTDLWADPILDALRPVAFVTGFSPVVYSLDASDTFALEIRLEE